jgi:hypothetical protein
MFRLERPSIAVNDPRVRGGPPDFRVRRYWMWRTLDIQEDTPRQLIIDRVAHHARSARGGKVKHLVLSCHGRPGYLALGEGFSRNHLALLTAWRGLIEKIWLPNCEVARARDGHAFCSTLARTVGCYVVAPTELQCDPAITLAPDQMTSFEGLVVGYDSSGNLSWSHRNRSAWTNSQGQCVNVPD